MRPCRWTLWLWIWELRGHWAKQGGPGSLCILPGIPDLIMTFYIASISAQQWVLTAKRTCGLAERSPQAPSRGQGERAERLSPP